MSDTKINYYISHGKRIEFSSTVTELDLSFKGISEFKCLDAPNLTSLDLRHNQLTEFSLDAPNIDFLNADIYVNINLNGTPNIRVVDGILTVIESSRLLKEFKILKGCYLSNKNKVFVAVKGKYSAHGDTINKAVADCNFKYLSENLNIEELVSEIRSKQEMNIHDFRLITGACESGVNHFLESKGLSGVTSLPLVEALDLIKGSYNWDKVKSIFLKELSPVS